MIPWMFNGTGIHGFRDHGDYVSVHATRQSTSKSSGYTWKRTSASNIHRIIHKVDRLSDF